MPQTEIILRDAEVELARFTLAPGVYVIGRDGEADLEVPTPLLSRRHAELTIAEDHILIADLQSANGTYVAEQRIEKPARLYPAQEVRLGDVTLQVNRERLSSQSPDSLAPSQAMVQRLLPPALLDERRYAVGRKLARGGMGEVLEAQQGAIERTVAMKVMLGARQERDVLRFIDEARIIGQLDHPNIVPIYELGIDAYDQLFYTMKLVRGQTLHHLLKKLAAGEAEAARKYPLPQLLTLFQKACDALAFAHAKGVIHRDLKPDNIMLGDFGSVLVMDWGLAKVIGRGGEESGSHEEVKSVRHAELEFGNTMAGSVMGTPAYMSPEQARGEVESLDGRSDIYSLGAILFEMLHQRRAFSGRKAREVMERVEQGDIEWGETKAPPSLVAVCRKAMARDHAKRYPTVEALQRDLTAYQNGFATGAEQAGLLKQAGFFFRRHRAVTTSVGVALILLAVMAVLFTVRVVHERNLAERRLEKLRQTAPSVAAEARVLMESGKTDEAVRKLETAVEMDPDNGDILLQRANYLEAGLHLHAAAKAYREMAASHRDFENAQFHADLCKRLLAANQDKEELPPALLRPLVDRMLAEGRGVEANPLARRVGEGASSMVAALRGRLREFTSQAGWSDARMGLLSDGTIRLDLNGFKVSNVAAVQGFPLGWFFVSDPAFRDLTPLEGMPLTNLGLAMTATDDLSPLAGAPLEILNLMRTQVHDFRLIGNMSHLRELHLPAGVSDLRFLAKLTSLRILDLQDSSATDLSPLRDLKLEQIDISRMAAQDLSPLAAMPLNRLHLVQMGWKQIPPLGNWPLQDLDLDLNPIADLRPLAGKQIKILRLENTLVTDIAPLRGLPLQSLDIGSNDMSVDLSPLADCPALEELILPKGFLHEEVLLKLPKLQRVRILGIQNDFLPVARFLKELSPDRLAYMHARALIDLSGVHPQNQRAVQLNQRGELTVDLSRCTGSNIPSLAGLPIAELRLTHVPGLTSLEAFRGMPLRILEVGDNAIHDLSPLRGMKLEGLNLWNTQATDLSPLRGMPLTRIDLNGTGVHDLSPLAGMPLRTLNIGGARTSDLSALAGAPLEDLACWNVPVEDLSFLRGKPLRSLSIGGTKVRDLSFVRGMPLERLYIPNTSVTDLAPLRGLPLQFLDVRTPNLKDLTPLLDLPKLERLLISGSPEELKILRKHPSLTLISQDDNRFVPVGEFFKDVK